MMSHDRSLAPVPGSGEAPVRRTGAGEPPLDVRLPGKLYRPRCFSELYDPGLGAAAASERGR